MKNISVKVTLIIMAMLLIVLSCSDLSGGLSDGDNETIVEEVNSLIHLRDGNIKYLAGFEFGDEFDYNVFEIAGYWDNLIYRIKDSGYNSVKFLFDGRGNRFSGLAATLEDDFFGIKPSEDTLEEIVDILGEPDERQKNTEKDGHGYAKYYFKRATLHISIDSNGIISYIEYTAVENELNDTYSPDKLTEYIKDLQTGHGYAENIYTDCDNLEQAHYSPRNENYDENQKEAIIKNYLQERGVNKDVPDGVTYNSRGKPLAEYYITKDNKICFIIHLWGDYWEDYEAGTTVYRDEVYCATFHLNELNKAGNIIYDFNSEQNVTREKLYDAQGKRMAHVSYEYIPGVPFPFITDYWNIDTGYNLIYAALCRNQKTWFYKEQAQFDESGKFIGCNGNVNQKDGKEYFPYPSICVYDADGKLEAIREEMQEEDIDMGWGWWDESIDYSGQIKFSYRENGNISVVDYLRSSYTHGTTDSNGKIYYDEKGRMIYNEYYITHGSDAKIYLYEEDAQRPWACLCWCSFINGFEEIYIFQPG